MCSQTRTFFRREEFGREGGREGGRERGRQREKEREHGFSEMTYGNAVLWLVRAMLDSVVMLWVKGQESQLNRNPRSYIVWQGKSISWPNSSSASSSRI